jgi:hypothetical protein
MGKPKPFDLLAEFGKYGLEHKLALNDPATRAAFGVHVAQAVDRALADPRLLHGQRAEAMFEALLVSLGEFKLLKPEDGGRVFPADRFSVPDFRVVLTTGQQWLVEVKNIYIEDPFRQQRKIMTRDYREGLEAYATATGAELKVAVFWARWSIWTLVTPALFSDASGDVVLDMRAAARGNELGTLGDRTIGTRSPLRLRLIMDPERTGPIGADGLVEAVVQSAVMCSGEQEITDPIEQQIAWILMQHGEWTGGEAVPIVEADRLLAIEFNWAPEEQVNEGFEMIGTLSRIFSRYFAEATLRDGQIVQLRTPHRPGWFEPLIRAGYASKALPLWRFQLRPSYADAHRDDACAEPVSGDLNEQGLG